MSILTTISKGAKAVPVVGSLVGGIIDIGSTIFGDGHSQAKKNGCAKLAELYKTGGFTDSYFAALDGFFQGMFIFKPTWLIWLNRFSKQRDGVASETLDKYESDLQKWAEINAPLTPEMFGISFKNPPKFSSVTPPSDKLKTTFKQGVYPAASGAAGASSSSSLIQEGNVKESSTLAGIGWLVLLLGLGTIFYKSLKHKK